MIRTNDLRQIVLNVNKPTVIKSENIQSWPIFSMTFKEWATKFDDQTTETSFDLGYKRFPHLPQFECFRTTSAGTMKSLLTEEDDKMWRCHNYKYLKDCPEVCKGGVNFADLGFSEVDNDISFWVGQTVSHTPCHYDTYGCNVVVQIFGRKSWLLFPPYTPGMGGTRIPYEESSVYSALNFFAPNLDEGSSDFKAVENNAYHVVLEPGSVLIVPPKWWHYVESVETSLNFNTWIKLDSDLEAHIEECKTRIQMRNYAAGLDPVSCSLLLNPNETDLLSESAQELQDTLDYLNNLKTSGKRITNHRNRHSYLLGTELDQLLLKYQSHVQLIKPMAASQFHDLIKENSTRFTPTVSDNRVTAFETLLRDHKELNISLIKPLLNK